ncbi:response regulator transcription factor, partial [Salinivibrio kushneri]|uniref:response regulator transcription factor n=1 Tax=Salinivibrio kushneri TaxID=1908198 RepID=UPI0009884152
MKKILLVDDHPVVNMAMKALLERNGYRVVGDAATGVEAIKLIKLHRPDITIIDLYIPLLDGIEVIKRSKKHGFNSRFLVLTSHPTLYYMNKCLEIGASGFISKEKDTDTVIDAVKAILSGYKFFPDIELGYSNEKDENDFDSLSEQEMKVFRYLALGMTNMQIANEMLVSNKTVSTYKSRIYKKLGINSYMDVFDLAKK